MIEGEGRIAAPVGDQPARMKQVLVARVRAVREGIHTLEEDRNAA
jgi:hypothetical protein